MESPTRQRQLEELDQVEFCTRILYQSRNELYVNMHFLDVSLSSLGFEADWNRKGIACDGGSDLLWSCIYFRPLQKGASGGKPLLSPCIIPLSVLPSVYKKRQREGNVGSGL